MILTLTVQSGTTEPNFFVFCWYLHACHTVNNSPIFLKSSLMDSAISASSQLSGEKTWSELSSLKAFLQLFKYYVRFFGQKTSKKMSALLKKLNLCSTYFLNGKWYWKIGLLLTVWHACKVQQNNEKFGTVVPLRAVLNMYSSLKKDAVY